VKEPHEAMEIPNVIGGAAAWLCEARALIARLIARRSEEVNVE
jgi:hypothetical protein